MVVHKKQNGCFHCMHDTALCYCAGHLCIVLWLPPHLLWTNLVSTIRLPFNSIFIPWHTFLIRCTSLLSVPANTFIWEAQFSLSLQISTLRCKIKSISHGNLVVTWLSVTPQRTWLLINPSAFKFTWFTLMAKVCKVTVSDLMWQHVSFKESVFPTSHSWLDYGTLEIFNDCFSSFALLFAAEPATWSWVEDFILSHFSGAALVSREIWKPSNCPLQFSVRI